MFADLHIITSAAATSVIICGTVNGTPGANCVSNRIMYAICAASLRASASTGLAEYVKVNTTIGDEHTDGSQPCSQHMYNQLNK
jgi:hypothetical protein